MVPSTSLLQKASEPIYCSSLGNDFTFRGIPIFLSSLLWSTLHTIPRKVSHYQTFETRLSNVVTAATYYLQKVLSAGKKSESFSTILLIDSPCAEREQIHVELDDGRVSLRLDREEHI